MPTQRQIFEALVERFEPLLRQLFLEAVQDIRSDVTLRLLVERLERGDVQGAIETLNIERSAFGRFEMAMLQAYNEGGIAQAGAMRLRDPDGNRVQFRFGVRDLGAENWIGRHIVQLSTSLAQEQEESLRQVMFEGLQRGDNPKTTARNIVGRVSRATNQRTGGLIGLSGPHQRAVENARQGLLSGDPERMRAYLQLTRRSKGPYNSFDRAVLAAIRNGRPVPAETVQRMMTALSNSYLELRGQTIARSETHNAIAASRADSFADAIRQGKVDPQFVTKHWRRSPAEHPRVQHTIMSGKSVPYSELFVLPDGTMMRYPHDENAPLRHTLNCKCIVEYRIDYIGQLVERRRAA